MSIKFEPFQKVLVRNCDEEEWKADFFSHMTKYGTYVCVSYKYKLCIPYEGNESLLGTTISYKEQTKYIFGEQVIVTDLETSIDGGYEVNVKRGLYVRWNSKTSAHVVVLEDGRTIEVSDDNIRRHDVTLP